MVIARCVLLFRHLISRVLDTHPAKLCKTNMSSKKGTTVFQKGNASIQPPIFQGICEFSGPVSDAWKTRLPNLSPFGSVTLPPQLKL